jgi:hypothetical protein
MAWTRTLGALCSALLISVAASCSGGSDKNAVNYHASGGTGGSGGSGGSTGGKDAGDGGGLGGVDGGGGTGGTSALAPDVVVTKPTAATDPSQDEVVVGDTADALCTAKQSSVAGSKPVDPSSVKIALLDGSGAVVDEFPGTPTTNTDEYSASFVLTTIPNGKITFRCTATDIATAPHTGTGTLATFVDHGPLIDVTTPAPSSAYALANVVPFAFTVSPAPLATNDAEAAIASMSVTVNGVSITPVKDPGNANGYKFGVDFNDTTLFPQPPSGNIPVVIKAKDMRTPTAAERIDSYSFALDGAGPVIKVTNPKDQDIIGGQVTLTFSVTDALTAVDKKTVSVELNQVVNLYSATTEWTNTGDNYTFTFDSANVSGSKVQVTINVTASDIAGNKAPGESLIVYLDNYPPTVDLDPGNVRTSKVSGLNTFCSESFDPLGPWDPDPLIGRDAAVNDMAIVTQSFVHFRSLVWERTNSVSGQTVYYYSKTDPNSVYLYLQPDGPTVPLLINNDSDPECDAIAKVVGGKALPNLHLNPASPAGKAWYHTNDTSEAPAGCPWGADETEPLGLCTNNVSLLSIVIHHTMTGSPPVVYGIGAMTGLECTGSGWELPSQTTQATQKEGWFCLASTATDNVGNVGISAPLRICFDDPSTAYVPPCAISSVTPPTCTDGCTPPPHFAPFIFPP